MKALIPMTAAALVIAGITAPQPALAARECRSTAFSMYRACRADSTESFWLEHASCINDSSTSFGECLVEVGQNLNDFWSECVDVKDARLDLCEALGDDGPYDPIIDPANFVSPEEASENPNAYFPLVIGTTHVYEAEDEVIVVTVTDETREILGVETTAVRDVVMDEEGETIEDTIDWFAQDVAGNVWYFGEIAKNFEDGHLTDVDGSFVAGREGAKPGIVMFASPRVGVTYRQEYALGEAEDAGEVLSLAGDESVEAAACEGRCVVTRDYNPLEPGSEENKYYAPSVGLILEVDPESGERVELVEIIHDGGGD